MFRENINSCLLVNVVTKQMHCYYSSPNHGALSSSSNGLLSLSNHRYNIGLLSSSSNHRCLSSLSSALSIDVDRSSLWQSNNGDTNHGSHHSTSTHNGVWNDNVKALATTTHNIHEKMRGNNIPSVSSLNHHTSKSILRVEKDSLNPYHDFRESMHEMIMHKGMDEAEDMEDLLYHYLKLNPQDLHEIIRNAFSDVWIDIILKIR